MVFLEVVDVQVFQEFDIDNRSIAVLDVGAFVKLGQRLADFEFRYLVLLNQDASKSDTPLRDSAIAWSNSF